MSEDTLPLAEQILQYRPCEAYLYFPKLLENPNVSPNDKQEIKELLIKPWNPYMRRHSSLTEKAKIENLSRRMCVQGLKIVVTANRLISQLFYSPHPT